MWFERYFIVYCALVVVLFYLRFNLVGVFILLDTYCAQLIFRCLVIVVLVLLLSEVQLWRSCFVLCNLFYFILDRISTKLLLCGDKMEDFWTILILFILVYWSVLFLSLVPVCFPICVILSFLYYYYYRLKFFFGFCIPVKMFFISVFNAESLRSENLSLFAIERDLILLFFPSYNLFLIIFTTGCGMYYFSLY